MISQEEPGRIPLGMAPAILAKRRITKPSPWCPKTDIDFDKYCDPDYPKIITYNDVWFATTALWKDIPKTPLVRSKYCVQFGLELNYKFETLHKTGSFHDRAALYCLRKLKKSQRANGIYTASLGNWAMAVAYHAHISHTPLTVVLPEDTMESIVENCQKFGANVVIHGKNLDEAKKQAFVLMAENGTGVFINGYDHPNVIAAAGTIGIEILEDLPQTDAILVPVGGGALLAGITAAVKHLKPSILGVEPHKCCCFFKAMENERPYRTEPEECIASSLGVPTVGANSFHTARSLIDKMVLVDDDWITRAILHLSEEEKYVVDGAGACPLSAILALEDILPELKDKTVVCVVTSGNINLITLTRAIERAKAIEGRIIKITVCIDPDTDDTKLLHRILSVIANVGCSVRDVYRCNSWFDESEFTKILQTIICETKNLRHACTLKRVLEKLFPNICDFYDEPYNPIPKCPCYPVRVY